MWMESSRTTSPNGVVLHLHHLFKFILLPLITISTLPIAGESRDIRPSDHGLAYQTSPETATVNSSAAMTTFFGQSTVSLPPPPADRNFTAAAPEAWWPPAKEEKRKLAALTVATIACGGAGVVLMAAAGLLFAYHYRGRRSGEASLSGENRRDGVIVCDAGTVTTAK